MSKVMAFAKENWIPLLGAAIGLKVIIVALIVGICCRKRRRKKKYVDFLNSIICSHKFIELTYYFLFECNYNFNTNLHKT